jgi:hypothetical protein
MTPERRRHPRCPPQSKYLLTCRPSYSTRLIDVSPGGACVETSERLPLGTRLVLEIRVPGDPDRVRAEAVVAWAGERAAGLRFERVDEDADLPDAPSRPPAEPRRRHKRFFPGRGDLALTPRTFWRALGFRPKDVALRIVDLSQSGAHLVCRERLKPGVLAEFGLKLYYPRLDVLGEARVVWCRRDTLLLAPEWHVGVSFRRVDDPFSVRSLERRFLG